MCLEEKQIVYFIWSDNFQAAIFKESEFGEFNLEDDLDTGMVNLNAEIFINELS